MKNKTKKNKGITLISLIVTIIVLTILASMAVYSGINAVNSSKLTAFTAEMKIMQTNVNDLYEKYKDGDEGVLSLGQSISGNTQAEKALSAAGIAQEEKADFRYYTNQDIVNLGIEGIKEREFLVDVKDRKVVSYEGFEYDGTVYYTLEQLPKGLYNVDYEQATVDFETSASIKDEETGEIIIKNITNDAYINKWQARYRVKGQENWQTTQEFSNDGCTIQVGELTTYEVQIFNGKDVQSVIKSVSVGKVEIPEKSDETAFSRLNGVIEITFLSGTGYSPTDIPNNPEQNMTSDMKAVYWENDVEKVEGESSDFDESKWYEYIAQEGATTNGGTSRWANTKTEDGSYFVWIPRYAYRIIYFSTEDAKEKYRAGTLTEESALSQGLIVGYSDARGVVDENGKTPSDLEEPVTSIGVGEKLLRPHPVFEDGSDAEIPFSQGEWRERLEGIWVSKYKISKSESNLKSIPGVSSLSYMDVGDFYTAAYNYDRQKESHMMKNSEWGAIAYLTESKYGRNGTNVESNGASGMKEYTAGALGATATTNKLQSTTGNEYGIYDMVGKWEYIAGYVPDSEDNSGNSFASTNLEDPNAKNDKKESSEYATVYNMISSNNYVGNYNANINKKFGDSIVEISNRGSVYDKGWNGCRVVFVGDASTRH